MGRIHQRHDPCHVSSVQGLTMTLLVTARAEQDGLDLLLLSSFHNNCQLYLVSTVLVSSGTFRTNIVQPIVELREDYLGEIPVWCRGEIVAL